MNLVRNLLYGAASGAAGTAALNALTYVDIAVRDREPSDLPARMAGVLAKKAGIDLQSKNRREAFGALLGYADGFFAGALLGLVRPASRGVSPAAVAIGLTALTMLLSEGTATRFGQTNPAQWSAADWASDIAFRMVYGLVACAVFDSITAER